MFRTNNISIEIQDRLIDGQEPCIISRVMDVPISWVYSEEESLEDQEPYDDFLID